MLWNFSNRLNRKFSASQHNSTNTHSNSSNKLNVTWRIECISRGIADCYCAFNPWNFQADVQLILLTHEQTRCTVRAQWTLQRKRLNDIPWPTKRLWLDHWSIAIAVLLLMIYASELHITYSRWVLNLVCNGLLAESVSLNYIHRIYTYTIPSVITSSDNSIILPFCYRNTPISLTLWWQYYTCLTCTLQYWCNVPHVY
jgi:hypothetical protein